MMSTKDLAHGVAEVRRVMERVDTNGDGVIDFGEFCALARANSDLELVLHSSELMPGGSPSFPDVRSIEALYRDLQVLFRSVAAHFRGLTLGEFAAHWQGWTARDEASREVAIPPAPGGVRA